MEFSAPVVLALTFFVAFLESLAVIGTLLPGVAVLFALAASASSVVSFPLIFIAAVVGAFCGDTVSYILGHKLKWRIKEWQIIQKYDYLFQRAQHLCQHYGILGLLIGRFIGPIRPVMPMMAGILDFPPSRFYITALVGAMAWAPLYLGPGYYLGAKLEMTWQHWVAIISVLAIPQIFIYISHQLNLNRYKKRLGAISLFAFTLLASVVIYSVSMPDCVLSCKANNFIYDFLHSLGIHQNGLIIKTAHFITNTADTWVVTVFAVCCVYICVKRQDWRLMIALVVAYCVPFMLKFIFDIDRPPGDHNEITQSFPSGHAYFSFLILMSFHIFIKYRHWLAQALGYWAIVIALSRLILGVHWISDILGGLLLAILMASLLRLSASTKKEQA